jgi:dTDP-4-amino-4,6-dideoxygalactose transaminase
MLTTSSVEYDRQFRLLRQHGMSVTDKERHDSNDIIFENYPVLGYNYRMTDIQAAMGREQLKKLTDMIKRRRYLAHRYSELLEHMHAVVVPKEPSWAKHNWQSYCIRLSKDYHQKNVMQTMLKKGIATRRGVMCSHRELAYHRDIWSCKTPQHECDCVSGSCKRLKESENAQDHCIILPLYHQMTENQQDRVVESLRAILSD